ncbi:MAG: hypothetical protein NTV29_07305 [Planctomycetota bacterium]|nr:hypothetical protein [Planctomycetota bacterium]
MQPSIASEPRTQGLANRRVQAQGVNASSGWRLLLDRRNLIPFMIAACMVIPVNLIGTFRLGELLVLALYPFYMKQILKALRNREVMAIVGLGLLWLTSQVLSDLYNATTMKNSLRGLGSIFLTMTTFLFFCGLYCRNPRNHLGTLLGAIAGGVLSAGLLYRFEGNNAGYAENIWDFYVSGWAHPAFAIFAFLFYRSHPWLVFPLGIVYGIVANMYGGRSDGLVVLISTLFFVYLWFQVTHSRGDLRYSMRSGLMICAVLLVPLFLLYVVYAQSGALGKAAKMQIDLAKNPYNPMEVLLLARNESVIALDAIYEKPILGHGSWANPGHLRRLYLLKMREIYGAAAPKKLIQDILPVHSVLLGAWVFGGLAGFIFWVYVIYRTFYLSNQLLINGSMGIIAIAVVYVPYFCWHVLFSPNAFARFSWPMSMAFLIFANAFFMRPNAAPKR